jgi:hypothetical protein
MMKKRVVIFAILKVFMRSLKKGNASIRLGLIVDLIRMKLIWEAQEVTLNPWMIVVKTEDEIQTIMEKKMPLSSAEGEILKDLLMEILPGAISHKQNDYEAEATPVVWSFHVNKTHA